MNKIHLRYANAEFSSAESPRTSAFSVTVERETGLEPATLSLEG